MIKSNTLMVSLFVILLLLVGCSNEKDIDSEMQMIMETVMATQSDQHFYHLIEAVIANEPTDKLIEDAQTEIKESSTKLDKLVVKTKEAKDVKADYLSSFENHQKALNMISNNNVSAETEEEFKGYITEASQTQQAAIKKIFNQLNIQVEDKVK